MTNYSAYWRTTFLAAIILHLLAGLALAFAVPKLIPERLFESDEVSWVDVELSEMSTVTSEDVAVEEIPSDEAISEFEFPELVIPEIPEPIIDRTPPPPPPKVEVKPPQTSTRSTPKVAKINNENVGEPKEDDSDEEDEPVITKPQMGQPPVTLKDYYPKKGSGLGYRGYVSVAATIGKDGTVKRTKVMRSSGRMFVDSIAEEAAKKWTFKPAMDQNGKPMECDKIITFDFKKFADA